MRGLIIVGLVLAYTALTVLASVGFKTSAGASDWRGFFSGQVVGNLAGFASVLALTGLLRLVPIHIAYPATQGLAVVGVQVISAWLLFNETIDPLQWVGTVFVVGGIVLIGGRG
jgi:multidrug transporter EmrE-like cation transporter